MSERRGSRISLSVEDCLVILQRKNNLPEAQLLSLVLDPLGLSDLIIQVDDEAVHESPFHIGSELVL